MGVANNHIRDQGATGLTQTVKNLRKRGLLTTGAGKDLAAARKPAIIDTHGVKVAILAYDAIAAYYHATDAKVGSAPMTLKTVKADIKAARAAGADVVVVFPHWGVEYRATAGGPAEPGPEGHRCGRRHDHRQSRPLDRRDGGLQGQADLVRPRQPGLRPDVVGSDDGGDDPRAHLRGNDLAQVRMRPHVILDKAQPNFLDATDGKVVLSRVYGGANLPW